MAEARATRAFKAAKLRLPGQDSVVQKLRALLSQKFATEDALTSLQRAKAGGARSRCLLWPTPRAQWRAL